MILFLLNHEKNWKNDFIYKIFNNFKKQFIKF